MRVKKLACKRTLRQVFICLSEAQTPIPPPPSYTLYVCIQYSYSHREGGSRGELNQREGVRGNSSQSWVENTKMKNDLQSLTLRNTLQSINSDKNFPLQANFFR